MHAFRPPTANLVVSNPFRLSPCVWFLVLVRIEGRNDHQRVVSRVITEHPSGNYGEQHWGIAVSVGISVLLSFLPALSPARAESASQKPHHQRKRGQQGREPPDTETSKYSSYERIAKLMNRHDKLFITGRAIWCPFIPPTRSRGHGTATAG